MQQRPADLDALLDSLPLPPGPMPPRQELIDEMVARLKEEQAPEIDIVLFEACSKELTDERLFKSTSIFWGARS